MAIPESCLLPAKHLVRASFAHHDEEHATDVRSSFMHAEEQEPSTAMKSSNMHPERDTKNRSENDEKHTMDGDIELASEMEFIQLPCVSQLSNEQDDEGIFLAGRYFLPPGFRFHPTDQELVLYYLKRKICGLKMELDIIAEIDLYEFEPWDLHEVSCLQTKDLLWYFFCPKMRKYPKGNRENRATPLGRWKPSGKDRPVLCGSRLVGTRKCLIYYDRQAKKEERTDWVMHEFRLSDEEFRKLSSKQNDFVLTRVFKKSGRGSKRGQMYGVVMEDDEADSLHDRAKEDYCASGSSAAADQHVIYASDKELQTGGNALTNADTPSESTQTQVCTLRIEVHIS